MVVSYHFRQRPPEHCYSPTLHIILVFYIGLLPPGACLHAPFTPQLLHPLSFGNIQMHPNLLGPFEFFPSATFQTRPSIPILKIQYPQKFQELFEHQHDTVSGTFHSLFMWYTAIKILPCQDCFMHIVHKAEYTLYIMQTILLTDLGSSCEIAPNIQVHILNSVLTSKSEVTRSQAFQIQDAQHVRQNYVPNFICLDHFSVITSNKLLFSWVSGKPCFSVSGIIHLSSNEFQQGEI